MHNLTINYTNKPYRIMAIDPGSREMGLTIMDVDLETMHKHVVFCDTFYTDFIMRSRVRHMHSYQDETYQRLALLHEIITDKLHQFNPSCFVTEGYYFRRMVTAYRSLAECCLMARNAVDEYGGIEFFVYEPSVVKQSVGVKGGEKDKTVLMDIIKDLPDISFGNYIDLNALDSHACDSVAVAYTRATNIF